MNAPLPTEVVAPRSLDCLPSILKALCSLTGMPFAALAHVHGTQWRACAMIDGLDTGLQVNDVLDVDTTFCQAVQTSHDVLDCPNIEPAALSGENHIGRKFNIRSYFAYPVYWSDGAFFGTLCTMDIKPSAGVGPAAVEAIKAFSEIIGSTLCHSLAGEPGRASSPGERGASHENVTMISRVLSVLGHDLRNPMHSLMAAIEMMHTKPLDPRAQRLLGMVEGSANRLSDLARLTLDFAKLQLVGQLPLQIEPADDLQARLEGAIAEVARHYPQRPIQSLLEGCAGVLCDSTRLSQAVGLVLQHAVKHAAPEQAIEVRTKSVGGEYFQITVVTPGHILDDALLPHLFDPFYQIDGEPKTAQLGIGLYIAAEIAKYHGGSLVARKDESGHVAFDFHVAQVP